VWERKNALAFESTAARVRYRVQFDYGDIYGRSREGEEAKKKNEERLMAKKRVRVVSAIFSSVRHKKAYPVVS